MFFPPFLFYPAKYPPFTKNIFMVNFFCNQNYTYCAS